MTTVSGELGAIAIKLPLPPGTLPGLWQAEDRFRKSSLEKFPGYYETGDAGYIDDDGYVYIMARTDDVINVAGHRLSTGAMEEILAAHPDVAEAAVVGAADELKGQMPLGFLTLKKGATTPHDRIVKEVVALVRERITAYATERCLPVENLVSPDLLRRVIWTPPQDPREESFADALRAGGAREWQVGLVAPVLSEAVLAHP